MKRSTKNLRQSPFRHIAWLFLIALLCMVITTGMTWAGFYPGNVDGNETIGPGRCHNRLADAGKSRKHPL